MVSSAGQGSRATGRGASWGVYVCRPLVLVSQYKPLKSSSLSSDIPRRGKSIPVCATSSVVRIHLLVHEKYDREWFMWVGQKRWG